MMVSGSISLANAQSGNGHRQEKIQALKIAYITQRLKLAPAEAEKFWPVYNQYNDEIRALRSSNKDTDVLDNEQKLLDIRKKYKSQFENILGPQRMNNVYNAERDFRNLLIKRLKEQKQQNNK